MNAIPWTVALLAMFGFGYWARGHDTPNPPAGGEAASPRAAETANCHPGAVPPAGDSSPPAAPSASPPPGVSPTSYVTRFQADLECGCHITHLLPRSAANSMRTAPCAGHGWCALCGWRIGGVGDGRYAYVWETCPAHDTNQARQP